MAGTTNQEFLGRGLMTPLQRLGGGDFISSNGVPLIRAAIKQIIGTELNEIKWRPRMAAGLERFKHKPNNESTGALIADAITTAIRKFEPRISTVEVHVTRTDSIAIAQVAWSVIDKNSPTNNVLVGPDSFTVTI
jgi:phage baseplate assembly protein W